jgi:hypothetical protein
VVEQKRALQKPVQGLTEADIKHGLTFLGRGDVLSIQLGINLHHEFCQLGGGLEKGYILACYRGIKDACLAKWHRARAENFGLMFDSRGRFFVPGTCFAIGNSLFLVTMIAFSCSF